MSIASSHSIPAALVNRSGSGIRFRTSQIRSGEIPGVSGSVVVVLPSGTRLNCRLTINPKNPWITGDELVHWIKARIPNDSTLVISVVEIIRGREYQLKMPDITVSQSVSAQSMAAGTSEENWRRLCRLLDGAESQSPQRRERVYQRIERLSGLSNIVRQCFGNRCQIESCAFTLSVARRLDPFISEVHHLEHLSRGGTHAAYNLCVLCANHHRLFHRDPSAHIVATSGDDVKIQSQEGLVIVKRDLSHLNNLTWC